MTFPKCLNLLFCQQSKTRIQNSNISHWRNWNQISQSTSLEKMAFNQLSKQLSFNYLLFQLQFPHFLSKTMLFLTSFHLQINKLSLNEYILQQYFTSLVNTPVCHHAPAFVRVKWLSDLCAILWQQCSSVTGGKGLKRCTCHCNRLIIACGTGRLVRIAPLPILPAGREAWGLCSLRLNDSQLPQ